MRSELQITKPQRSPALSSIYATAYLISTEVLRRKKETFKSFLILHLQKLRPLMMTGSFLSCTVGSNKLCSEQFKALTGSNCVRVFRNVPNLLQSSSHCNRTNFKIETVLLLLLLLLLNVSKLQVKTAPVYYKGS